VCLRSDHLEAHLSAHKAAHFPKVAKQQTSTMMRSITPATELITDRLEVPSLDNRSYKVVKIATNQLEVLLVHDADTDKASAAMDVNVGNFSDPEDTPGMGHAVEHLLFMGTKKVIHAPNQPGCRFTRPLC
jgi:hypothetical protein